MSSCFWQQKLFELLAQQHGSTLYDPRSGLTQDHFSRHQLLELSRSWSRYFAMLQLPLNTAVQIPMRVAIQSVATLFGALDAGLFPILIKPSTPVNLALETIKRSGGGVLLVPAAMQETYLQKGLRVVGGEFGGLFAMRTQDEPIAHPLHADGSLLGIMSSGSTGHPKVIVQTLKNVMQNAGMHTDSIGVTAQDTVALSLPLNFSSGLVAGLFGTLLSGASAVFVDPQRINVRPFLAENPVTVCMGTPGSILNTFGSEVLGKIKKLTVGGDVLHTHIALQLLDELVLSGQVYATYGMTEAGPRIATAQLSSEMVRHYNAVPLGQPLQGVKLGLRHDASIEQGGELTIETPTAMVAYLNDEAGTSQVMDKDSRKIFSGDLFRQQDKQFIFVGRKKRIIVRGGENIYPAFIESKILNLYDLDDVWVTSESHHELGEVPKAFILTDRPIDLNRLSRELRQHLPTSHIPVNWEVVTALPQGARK